eukprot:RCo035527
MAVTGRDTPPVASPISPTSKPEAWHRSHPLKPIPSLTWTLLGLLVHSGPLWVWMAFRLMVFVVLLLPFFLRTMRWYFTSRRLLKNIPYGRNSRNYLDLYTPTGDPPSPRGFPVVVLMTGGAWIIGYKAWFAVVARCLMRGGVMCVTPDYRNFPQGTVKDMVYDTHTAMRWVFRHIRDYGGDPDQIYLVGQSAGAHLSFLAMLDQAELRLGTGSPSCGGAEGLAAGRRSPPLCGLAALELGVAGLGYRSRTS